MSNPGVEGPRMNRLYWRSRRGLTELELRLLPFFEAEFATLPDRLQLAYEQLLELEDPQLFDWLQGRGAPDDPAQREIVDRIRRR